MLERTSEKSELDGVIVTEVDSGISSVIAFLRFVENSFRGMLVSVTSCPSVDAVLRTTCEFKQFVPVMFNKVQGNRMKK